MEPTNIMQKRNSNLDDTFLLAHQVVYGSTVTTFTISLDRVSYVDRKKMFRSAASLYAYALFRMNDQISHYPEINMAHAGYQPDLDPEQVEWKYLECNVNFVNDVLKSFSDKCGSEVFCVMEKHYVEGVVLEELADEMNMSRSRMYRYIEKYTKCVLGDGML